MFVILMWTVTLHQLDSLDITRSYQNVSVVNDGTVLLNCTCFRQNESSWVGPKRNFKTNIDDKSPFITYSQGLQLNHGLTNSNIQLIGNYDKGKCSLKVKNISDNDTGNYTCNYVVNGEAHSDVYFVFTKHPTKLEARYLYTEHDIFLKCIPTGSSENFTCITWEHQSEYKEHIRYLDGIGTDHETVKRTTDTSKRFQDNGYYICRVCNGISDVNRSLLADCHQYIAIGGAPEFMTDNQKVQHGILGKEVNVTVKIYSKPVPTNATIKSNDTKRIFGVAISNRTIKAVYLLHNSNVHIPVIQLTFRMKLNTTDDFGAYIITVCNSYGCSEFVTSILDPTNVIDIQYLQWLPVPVLLLISLAIGIIVPKRNRKKPEDLNDTWIGRQNEDIDDEAQVSVAVDNTLYQSSDVLNSQAVRVVDGVMSDDREDLPCPAFDDNDNGNVCSTNSVHTAETHNGPRLSFKMCSDRLNYSEVVFTKPHSAGTSVIHGIENRTIYSDIDLYLRVELPESSSGSDTDDDDVCVKGNQPLNSDMEEL